MKKITKFSVILSLSLFACFFALTNYCLAQSIVIGQGQGVRGDTIVLNLDLSGVNSVVGFNLDVQYDTNVLENPSASASSALSSAGKDLSVNTLQAGVFRLVVFGANQNIIPVGNVATVSFQIKSGAALGATQLALANLTASDVNAQAVSISGGNSSIEVVSSDTTPPTRSNGSPTGVLPSGTTQTTISLTTNKSTTCKYSTTAGIVYASMPNTFSTTGGTSHSTTVSGLTDENTYNYYIRCQDGADNANTDDFTITFSIASPDVNHLPIGFLDSANQEYITGWAYDQDAGSNPVNVHIYINGQPTANVTANVERQDLVDAGACPDAYHGFSWAPTGLSPGEYTVNVYAINQPEGTNPELDSSPQTITITIPLTCGDGTCDSDETCSSCEIDCGVCPITNNPPTANAGTDQTIDEGTIITLDGSLSSDPDGDTLTYQWTQVSGTNVSINNSTNETASFTTPDVNNLTDLVFKLTVNDRTLSDDDMMSVAVRDITPSPPTCGDGTCDSDETCSSCFQDCSVCPFLPQFEGVSVLKADDDDKIYFIVNNQRRWISSPEVFLSYMLASDSQMTVPRAELEQYSLGQNINQPSLPEGNLIRAKDGYKVYIIKPPYKRHIFNPAVFNMYQHFSWDSIREVDESVVNSYITSDIYQATNDYRVYSLNEIDETQGKAVKHHLNVTAQQFTDKGYSWGQVFIVNPEERDYYETGEDLTVE